MFTTEEEVGLNGAKALDKSLISARTMINMDSEEEGIATISCAGGLRIECSRKIVREEAEGTLVKIVMSGLKGGHSGTDIDLERKNANRLMARVIYQLMKIRMENLSHLPEELKTMPFQENVRHL